MLVKVNKPSFNFMFFYAAEMNLKPAQTAHEGAVKTAQYTHILSVGYR